MSCRVITIAFANCRKQTSSWRAENKCKKEKKRRPIMDLLRTMIIVTQTPRRYVLSEMEKKKRWKD